MQFDRNARLLCMEEHGTQPLDLTIGQLMDGIRAQVIADLKNDADLVAALAAALAPHLTASVRPT